MRKKSLKFGVHHKSIVQSISIEDRNKKSKINFNNYVGMYIN